MATATALTSKRDQAIQLRAEAQTLGQDVAKLREKLEIAQRTLGQLQEKRQKFTEDAAHGRTPKPGEIAALNVALDECQIPFDGLTSAVNSKQAALDMVRANLETLSQEIALEEQQEARHVRFDALEKQGREIAARVTEKIRSILEEDFPALDQVRNAVAREYINIGGVLNVGTSNSARALVSELGQSGFMDGSFLAVERRLLRAGWQPTGTVELTLRSLRPPR